MAVKLTKAQREVLLAVATLKKVIYIGSPADKALPSIRCLLAKGLLNWSSDAELSITSAGREALKESKS